VRIPSLIRKTGRDLGDRQGDTIADTYDPEDGLRNMCVYMLKAEEGVDGNGASRGRRDQNFYASYG
jgi:hypothetical protein